MDRHKLALECEEIEKNGGCVRDYLREKGFISPWGTWFNLQREELGRTETEITLGKEQKEMKKVSGRTTREKLGIIVKAVQEGKDPYEVLEGLGYVDPLEVYSSVKKWAKENMPDEYNKLPMNMRTYRAGLKKRQGKPTEKEPMKLEAGKNYEVSVEESPEKMQAEFIKHVKGECEIPMPKAEEIIPKEILKDMKITKPVNYGGYDVTAIRHESLGEFYRDVKYKTVDWRAPDGAEVSLPAGMWFELADEIPRILAILGVGRCEQG